MSIGDDPCPGHVEGHELDLEGVLEADVGDVRLAPRHAVEATDPGRGPADAVLSHGRLVRSAAAARTASMICS